MTNMKPLRGTAPKHPPSAQVHGSLDDDRRLRVTVVLRPEELPHDHPVTAKIRQNESEDHAHRTPLTQDELEAAFSPNEDHVAAIRRFAANHDLDVVEVSQLRHDLVLEGEVSKLETAFGVKLEHFEHGARAYHGHQGEIHLPKELHDFVVCVLGLDSIPIHGHPMTDHSNANQLLSPHTVGTYYGFPADAKGAGQRIALLEFYGGYHSSDMKDFFSEFKIDPPAIRDISVDGAMNDPLDRKTLRALLDACRNSPPDALQIEKPVFEKFKATMEVTMDLQIVSALAPEAEIDVYFLPYDTQSYRRGIYAALGDSQSADGHAVKPATVIAISWGSPEDSLSPTIFNAVEDPLIVAKKAGVSVCCASGDFGSSGYPPGMGNERCNVSFPASSPHALACGGTSFLCDDCIPKSETVWNEEFLGCRLATTGGVSGQFQIQSWQKNAGVPKMNALTGGSAWRRRDATHEDPFWGRGVPDVAASADLSTGYHLIIGGESVVGGGTSAAAPLWAALIACLNGSLGHNVGWITPVLYQPEMAEAFRPIHSGDNKVTDGIPFFSAGAVKWNGCTGLGTPIGTTLLNALRALHKRQLVSPD